MATHSSSTITVDRPMNAAMLFPFKRNLLEALGSTVTQKPTETGAYRFRGQDSLTWGDQVDWTRLNIIRYSFDSENAGSLGGYFEFDRAIRQIQQSLPTSGYELRNPDAVLVYVAAHRELPDFLKRSQQQLRRFFGPKPSFVLEIVRDPDASDPSDFLFVNIRTAMPVDDAMACLNQFDEAWYLDQIDSFGELVNFNLEFYEL